MLPRVFITGVGVVSSIGMGKRAFYESLEAGRSGIGPVQAFDPTSLGRKNAGEIKDFVARDHLTAAETARMGRCSAMTVAAARMAVADAGFGANGVRGPRVSVVVGTTMGEADVLGQLDEAWIRRGADAIDVAQIPKYGTHLLPTNVARALGATGMVMALPGACAAGNYAIGFGADLIRSGRADIVVAGASEVIQELQFSGFARLAAMAPEKCQPFDKNRGGLILGEGSGVLVLESEAHALGRNAHLQAEVGGYGITCDGYHITRPHPDAAGSIEAMRQAISRSGLLPADVDFINAHGTGTHHNDLAESKVVHDVFGARRVPISSMKSMIGHCMGAASSLEAIGCIMTIERGVYPPTIAYETPDPECDLDVVANVARKGPARVVVNNALAFGGYNAVTLFAKPGVLPEVRA